LVPAGDIRLKTGHRVENREPVRRGGFLLRRSPAGAAQQDIGPRFAVRGIAIKKQKRKRFEARDIALKKTKKEKEKMDQVKNGPSDVERRSRGRERRDDD
jgi:hypothetical protein